MAITQTNRNQAWDKNGNLVQDEQVVVDITRESVQVDLRTKVRAALAVNQTYINRFQGGASPTQAQAIAWTEKAARELSAIIRLVAALDGAVDLLVENTDT